MKVKSELLCEILSILSCFAIAVGIVLSIGVLLHALNVEVPMMIGFVIGFIIGLITILLLYEKIEDYLLEKMT